MIGRAARALPRAIKRGVRRLAPDASARAAVTALDVPYYMAANPDLVAAGADPYSHFARFGAAEGRAPSAWASQAYVRADLDHASLRGQTWQSAYLASGMQTRPRLLFVSHDASRTGAPAIILRLLEMFSRSGAFECFTILDVGGERLAEFEALSHTYVMSHSRYDRRMSEEAAFSELERLIGPASLFAGNRPVCALVNSAESRRLARHLARLDVPVVSLIHEIAAYYEPAAFTELGEVCQSVVFPSQFVKRAAARFSDMDMSRAVVRGQGLLTDGFGSMERARCRQLLREALGVEEDAFIVLNVGTMDLRKGGDLFVDAAKLCLDRLPPDAPVYFAWYGKADATLSYPADAVARHGLEDRVRFMPATPEIEQVFLGGDLFLLTARADPFPCVIHEAMACGLPVIAFQDGGGAPELIGEDCGRVVEMANLSAVAEAVHAYWQAPELHAAHGQNAKQKIARDWDYLSYQRDLYGIMQRAVPAPSVGWPPLAPPWAPGHLVIMRGSHEDLSAFERCFGPDQTVKDVALVDGRFGPEADAVAARLRALGHAVRFDQPREDTAAARAAIIASRLNAPRPQAVTLVNALGLVETARLKPLGYPVSIIETSGEVGVQRLYDALPYVDAVAVDCAALAQQLEVMNPGAEAKLSLLPAADPEAARDSATD